MAAVTMRARPVDNCKPLPILLAEDVPDIHEATSVQRSLPQMATGMEKEEEEVRCYVGIATVSNLWVLSFPYILLRTPRLFIIWVVF